MLSRRAFLKAGAGFTLIGLPGRHAEGRDGDGRPDMPVPRSAGGPGAQPFDFFPDVTTSQMGQVLPFAIRFNAEEFLRPHRIINDPHYPIAAGRPDEEASVVVVGGGLSGLSAAYLLREHQPLVLEQAPRFGGYSKGEVWENIHYSMGGAYLITPDPGTRLEQIYTELGMHKLARVFEGNDLVELLGEMIDDFWEGGAAPPNERNRYRRFASVVRRMGYTSYPDVPVPQGPEGDWLRELDARSFKADVEMRMPGPLPRLLEGAVQLYCYSSFGAGYEEVSAFGGWNFYAAEQFGKWIFPGGLVSFSQALWQKLAQSIGVDRLRANVVVKQVQPVGTGVRVLYVLPDESIRTVQARKVVMAVPKFVCKHLIRGLDDQRMVAIEHLRHRAYIVANVLINAPFPYDFYDLWLMRDGNIPTNDVEAMNWTRITDVITGHWARGTGLDRSVLTLYWPLPFDSGRTMLGLMELEDMIARIEPQILDILGVLEVAPETVLQVRLTRWGHAMPISAVGFIADGYAYAVREPIDERIFFVHHDNWALPAIETLLIEAFEWAPRIASGLRRR